MWLWNFSIKRIFTIESGVILYINEEIIKKWNDYIIEKKYDCIYDETFPKQVVEFFEKSNLVAIEKRDYRISAYIEKDGEKYQFYNLQKGYLMGVEHRGKRQYIYSFFNLKEEDEWRLKDIEDFIKGFPYEEFIKE